MFLAARSLLADFGPLALKSALVLAAIAGAAWAIRRFLGPRAALNKRGRRMRLIERLHLAPRRALYVVEVDGERLVVGVTEGGIAFHRPKAPPAPAPGEEEAAPTEGDPR